MPNLSRRTFLQTTGVATAGAMLGGCSTIGIKGANNDVRLGVVGLNGRGKNLVDNSLAALTDARITALCDVDGVVLDNAARALRRKGQRVQTFIDYRELLEKGDVDAVVIVTPNHHHALQAIWACQAGKDVYLEKPVSHEIWEGRQVIAAAEKYQRIIQVGSQCRSSPSIAKAVAWVRAGNLGKILSVRGLCYKRRDTIGLTEGPQKLPPYVDYNLWLGPAPEAPLRRKHLHYDWHWQWPYGNGDLGNQGVHQMDIARWFLGEQALAPRVVTVGGRLGYVDDGQTPNTFAVVHDYQTAPLIFEVRGLPDETGSKTMDKFHNASIGVIIECEGGRVVVPSYVEAKAMDKDGKVLKDWKDGKDAPNHAANFIAAMRSRKTSDLTAPITEGHLSSSLCHVANICHRTGQIQKPGVIYEQIKSNAAMSETYARMTEHLGNNGVDLEKTPLTLGAVEVDVTAQSFIGNDAANTLLRREYRSPFVVPETV